MTNLVSLLGINIHNILFDIRNYIFFAHMYVTENLLILCNKHNNNYILYILLNASTFRREYVKVDVQTEFHSLRRESWLHNRTHGPKQVNARENSIKRSSNELIAHN